MARHLGARIFAFGAVFLAWAAPACAYPWMIRHDYAGCAACHVDPSGGELLTQYGRSLGDEFLPRRPHGASAEAATVTSSGELTLPEHAPGFAWGAWDTPPWLDAGGSLRGALTRSLGFFPMQVDVQARARAGRFFAEASVGVAQVPQNSLYGRDAFVTNNQGNQLNLISRTQWLGFYASEDQAWQVRAGRLNLPFGVRVPEHILWARQWTLTSRDADQEDGAAVAWTGDRTRGELMGIAGNYQVNPDRWRRRGYSGYVETIVAPGLALGVSSMLTRADADVWTLEQAPTTRAANGVFARAKLAAPLALLAEADVLDTSRRSVGYVGFAQLDFEHRQGFHWILTGELGDQGAHAATNGVAWPRLPGEGKPRVGVWGSVDWFFWRELDARFDLIGRQDGATFLLQVHAYL